MEDLAGGLSHLEQRALMFVIFFGAAFGQMMGTWQHCPIALVPNATLCRRTERETQPHTHTHTHTTHGKTSTPNPPARIPKESPQQVDMYLTVT